MSLLDTLANSNVAINITIGRINTPITTVIPSTIWYYGIVPLWRNNHILDAILCPDVHKHPLPVALQTPPKWQSTSHGASKVAKDSQPGTPAGFSQLFVIGLYAKLDFQDDTHLMAFLSINSLGLTQAPQFKSEWECELGQLFENVPKVSGQVATIILMSSLPLDIEISRQRLYLNYRISW